MKKFLLLVFLLAFLITGCEKDSITDESTSTEDSGAFRTSSSGIGGSGSGNGQGEEDSSGKITAGEWNDLENWNYWSDLKNNQEFDEELTHWEFYFNNRVSISVKNMTNLPVIDVPVELKTAEETIIWKTRTDNKGKAELWVSPFSENFNINMENYFLWINGNKINTSLHNFSDGTNTISIKYTNPAPEKVELSFIVDATGSMSDELEFLKDDLQNVIQKVKNSDSSLKINTSTVFYRDEGDDYVVRHSDFSSDINQTHNFINQQAAGGGGDFPEAVHTALKTALQELNWSTTARTRLAFLILDAPPHHNEEVIEELKNSIQQAAEMGIKLIPITASGIDKETEFLMRFFSMATNGTYVFITNHSGIGNDHIEPSIGDYEVEYLNDLLVRLIKEYAE